MEEIELKKLRKKREKHFLQKNGDIIAKVYNDDIHYLKDGEYKEIDNTLIKENNYYKNKSNSYQVYFNNSSSNNLMKLETNNYYLNVTLQNSNAILTNVNNSEIEYINIKDGIDFKYQLLPTQVKENIVIQNKEFLIDEFIFDVDTNLNLEILDNKIKASYNGNIIFTIENPYMFDSNNLKNENIYYELIKKDNSYQLKLVLDKSWLEEACYPVMIDPTITTEENEVYDTYIYPGDKNINRNIQDILKVGVEKENGKEIINRALIKFDLPTIGTGSQITRAYLNLIGYLSPLSPSLEIINIHEVTSNWTENDANWDKMNNKYNPRIEASFEGRRSQIGIGADTDYQYNFAVHDVDITSLVKKWYSDKPNYGIMLKANKEVYKSSEVPAFYSKNNNMLGDNPKPVLIIQYRNQNGLESYMNYQKQNFTDGSTYFNTYNGNLTGVFHVGNTIGGKLPVSLELIYNTNDVVLKNNIGVGLGNRFNLNQTIKESEIENYLEYVDSDGTIHYFYKIENDDGINYHDEDGLNLTIEKIDNEYVLMDKEGNKSKFNIDNKIGYLSEIIDISENHNMIYYDNKHKIVKIKDANDSEINITYETNKITVFSPNETIILNYANNKLNSIVSKLGTTLFTYNSYNIIETITDINGQKIKYEYYNQSPYRIKKISQYGLNESLGAYFNVTYGFESTTIIDNKNREIIMTYNDIGNLISMSNLKTKNDLKSAYGIVQEYGYGLEPEDGQYSSHKNKLLSSGIPNKYVKNYISNSSFENEDLVFITDCDSDEFSISRSCEYATNGMYCLKASCMNGNTGNCYKTVEVPKGHYYTLSIYSCGIGESTMSIGYEGVDGWNSEAVSLSNIEEQFVRNEVTIFYPTDAISDLRIDLNFNMDGIYYMDDIQLEEGEVANKYNLLDNSDFSLGLDNWDIGADDIETLESINNNEVFEIVSINDIGDKALKINMNPARSSFFSRSYQINGKKGDEYNISFWYKNEGLKTTGIMGDPVRNQVTISYEYAEDGEEDGHCPIPAPTFNPNDTEWQYYSTSFVAEKDFTSLTLYFDQECNANAFYITNLYLFKDVRENYFDYDSSDNMTAYYGLNQEKTKYNYDSNNQLIQEISPKGNRFNYEYDNIITDRVLSGISEIGVSNEIKYDSFENPVITRIKSVGSTIEDEKAYQIRAKGTDRYLVCIGTSVSLGHDNCGHTKWVLEKVNDELYRMKYILLENAYLKEYENTLTIENDDKQASLFRIHRNFNGSYSIRLKEEDSNSEISRNEIENLMESSLLNNYTVADFFQEIVSSNYTTQKIMDRHINKSIKNDVISEDMLVKTLSSIINDNELSKITLVSIAYEAANDCEYPKYISAEESIVRIKTFVEDDPTFEFYFEQTENEIFIEGTATYTEDGKFITSVTDTNFNTTYYDIDNLTGLVKSITDAKSNTTTTKYDTKDRPISITNGNKQINYSYNDKNQLNKITEGNKEYNFIYDDFNNIKQVKIGNNITLVTNQYEENNGNLKSVIYGNNQKIDYDYDEFDRIKTIEKMDNTYHFKYDNNGYLTKINSNNDNRNYIYDLSKNLSEYKNNDFKINYTYDQNNNLINSCYYLENIKNNITNVLNKDDMIIKTDFNNHSMNYNYDALGRLVNKNIDNNLQTNYEYVSNGKRTSLLLKSIETNNDKYSYRYDTIGNIIGIYHQGGVENKYNYDQYNQLITERNYLSDEKIIYNYDNHGNILSKEYYDMVSLELEEVKTFEYNNPNWEDQLTSYNGKSITYDAIGNPINIGLDELEWINARQLKTYKHNDQTIQYSYDINGIRTSKIVNGIETKYLLEGRKIIFEQTGTNMIYYIRNGIDDLIGFKYNNTIYYYLKNIFNDIIGILDSNYSVIARYRYDSWGNILSIRDNHGNDISSNTNHIANINPFRYRSYYYDRETNLYYLNSRYYNPEWGRFLNPDSIIGANRDILGYNLYAYCSNNPVANIDPLGTNIFKDTWDGWYNFGKDVGKTAEKVKRKLKTSWQNIKKIFVFEGNVGFGVGIDVGTGLVGGQLGFNKSFTYKIENEHFSNGGTNSYGVSVNKNGKEWGYSNSYYHETHLVPGNIDESTVHNYPLATINSIKNCDYTTETNVILGNKKISKYSSVGVEEDDSTTFLGITIGGYAGIGGTIKIGFNIKW